MPKLHLVDEHMTPAAPELPARVVVASFRFRPSPDDIHGGQDAFVHGLVRALRAQGVAVDVLTFRGRDDAKEAIVEGARVHLLDTELSSSLTAHEAHQRGTWRLLEVMAAYSAAVERFLPELRARHGGGPLLILSHDVAEARWVKSARRAGDRIITFAHVLFSEFALEDLTAEEFERMNDAAHFPLHVRTIGRLALAPRAFRKYLERIAKVMTRTEAFAILPGAARTALEGEHAAFVDAQRVLFPSEVMRQKVMDRYVRRDPEAALEVAPWGVELTPVRPETVTALRTSLGIGAEDRVLVTMSRISPDKRIDALLAALARIDAEGPSALAKRLVAVICGRPTFLDDHAFHARLVAEARRLRHVRVRFAGFQRGEPRTAHLDLAAGGGRFVQVGRYEAFGLGIAEALSRGIPAITSDTDGARSILDQAACASAAEAAAVVRPGRGEAFDAALARTIVRELSGEVDRSRAAAEQVAARFTWDGTLRALSASIRAIAPETLDRPALRPLARAASVGSR